MEDAYGLIGNNIFLPLIPMTLLLISVVAINNQILFPRLLLKNRISAYISCVLAMAFFLGIISVGIEYLLRNQFSLPHRISNYGSPWIIVDTFCNSILLAVIFLGLGMLQLFKLWATQLKKEKKLTKKLKKYIATVKDRLNPEYIFSTLKKIASDRQSDSEEIATNIRNLSNYLRQQLYELPEPPQINTDTSDSVSHSRIAKIIVSKKYKQLRHMIFLSLLVIISCGIYFNTPDQPEFTAGRLLGQLSMFAVLTAVAYINILWLYTKFMLRGDLKKYVLSVCILMLLLSSPIIAIQILTYEQNVYATSLPASIIILSTISTMLTLSLFIGGVSAALLLHNWMETTQRIILLRAETVRQEYAYLRKQINPHFLFNILNNIGISVYDDPEYARSLISNLISLLEYQLGDLDHDSTTLEHELYFIRSYFSLEATRREKFNYVIETELSDESIIIPNLLFIPIIENGVKYSCGNAAIPDISVLVSESKDRLTLICVNPYDAEDTENHQGGKIGLSNTRRRLELLYDDNYTLECSKNENTYNVKLEIPLT